MRYLKDLHDKIKDLSYGPKVGELTSMLQISKSASSQGLDGTLSGNAVDAAWISIMK